MVPGTNKNPGQFGSNNRKRTPATRSSSPPVAQWADRRPQKISRTARRTNLVPIISNSEEATALDNASDVTGSEIGPGFSKRIPANSPQLFKSKGDHFASSTPSESEESGAAEFRSRDKGKKYYEVEEKGEQNVQKFSNLVPPVRKNKMVNGEEVGDGIRRQNRTGRGFGSSRGVMPPVEKIRHVGTMKQLRTARQGFDKSESKSGRPPTRKLSDRKAYTRQKNITFNAVADFPVGSDDGHEELVAAAKAVINPNHVLSSPFWRHMEPLFGFVSDLDMSYLKQQIQGSTQSNINTKKIIYQDIKSTGALINGAEIRSIEPSPGRFASETTGPGEIPLCQRLLAALISEEGNDELSLSGNNGHSFNAYGSAFEFDTDVESNAFNQRSLQSYELGGRGNFSGHKKSYTLRSSKESIHSAPDHIMSMSDSTKAIGFDHLYNGPLSDPAMTSGITFSGHQYANMSLNERLLIEIQSIGLFPELVPDLPNNGSEGISGEICRLEEKLHKQVSRKKYLLDSLLESTNEARDLQEKEFEQLCIDKLTAVAYQKYMSCWGPHAPKSVGSKVAKQAALGFARRTLDRCHEFESTGKSCFNEPIFKEMFRSGSSDLNDTQLDIATNNELGKINGKSIERVPGAQLCPSLSSQEIYPSDAFHFSEQTNGKDENIWSGRVKKRELYLDDVVAGTSSGFGATILNSAKGKRSERDREGKVNGLSKNGGPKVGRPASGNIKGERKNKTKLKQKTTQLSASLNGPIGKFSDQNRTFSSVPNVKNNSNNNNTVKGEDAYKYLETEEPLDFSHLQIPEMDVLGDQGEDIGSWLNIDDDILQDDDFMGLEIPMDDLSDLNMMV
ncbi:uncharacterized protein LOC143549876 [Bidens hawaiensis]|uniref:uncharacterized protein LOC143549876 n=1 Tax=Bidens hawaiensis TaxID=980011 RepID=UPI00404AED1F